MGRHEASAGLDRACPVLQATRLFQLQQASALGLSAPRQTLARPRVLLVRARIPINTDTG